MTAVIQAFRKAVRRYIFKLKDSKTIVCLRTTYRPLQTSLFPHLCITSNVQYRARPFKRTSGRRIIERESTVPTLCGHETLNIINTAAQADADRNDCGCDSLLELQSKRPEPG